MTEEKKVHPIRKITMQSVASAIGILAVLVPIGRWVLTPWFVTVATEALSAEIDKRIALQVDPTNDVARALLQDKIDELETKIAVLEARWRRDPTKFSDADAVDLASAKSRLAKQLATLAMNESRHKSASGRSER